MRTERRLILKAAGLAALTAAFGNRANAAANVAAPPSYTGAFRAGFDSVVQTLAGFYQDHGYHEIEPLPLQTGTADFNEGLRYDETGVFAGTNEMVVQSVARIEDAGKVDRRDVLGTFTIFSTSWHSDDRVVDSLERALAVLTGPLGLNPEGLLLVSVPQLESYRPALESIGLDWNRQVILRDADEARMAGDGSGHFRHPDPSIDFEVPTVSLHYWIGDGDPVFDATYPLPADWTEIGEHSLVRQDTTAATAMGVERLVLARTGLTPA